MRINVRARLVTGVAIDRYSFSHSSIAMGRTSRRVIRPAVTSTRTSEYNHCNGYHITGCVHRDGVGPNQICTLYGANPGQSDVSGHAYLDVGYQLNTADIWRRNFLVLLGFFFLFQLTQVLLVEFYPVSTWLKEAETLDLRCCRSTSAGLA